MKLFQFPLLLLFVGGIFLFFAQKSAHADPFHYMDEREIEFVREISALQDAMEFEAAWRLARRAKATFPESYEISRVWLASARDFQRLNEVFNHVIVELSKDETNPVRLYEMAWALVLQGSVDQARHFSDLLHEIDNQSFEPRRVRLVINRNQRDIPQSDVEREYRQFLADFADHPRAHHSYLAFLQQSGQWGRKYRRALADALSSPNPEPEIFLYKTRNLAREVWFDHEEALDWIRTGRQIHPLNSSLISAEARYLRSVGRNLEALEVLQFGSEKMPNHGGILETMALLKANLCLWEESLSALERMRELRYQPRAEERAEYLKTMVSYDSGDLKVTLRLLEEFLAKHSMSPFVDSVRRHLTSIQTASPEKSVRILCGIPMLEQIGNYCGPATLSMILGFWGIERNQHEIARHVYTGIAGTPPQIISSYAESHGLLTREFEGNDEDWKRLIDAGFPVLWLKMLGSQGGHYYVIVGYDDIMKEWIVHNPHEAARRRMPFEAARDIFLLGDLRRSMVLFPEEKQDHPALAGLRPTARLAITNSVFYVASGSNLFRGIFPALPINLLCAAFLGFLIGFFMKKLTFPAIRWNTWHFAVAAALIILPLNLIISITRWSEAVSVLLGLHLGIISLVPLLALIRGVIGIMGDFLHPREAYGTLFMVMIVWMSLAIIDEERLEFYFPIGAFLIGLPFIMWPRWQLLRAEKAMRRANPVQAEQLIAPIGLNGKRYYAGICVEMDALLLQNKVKDLRTYSESVLKVHDWPEKQRRVIRFYWLLAMALEGSPEFPGQVKDFVETEKFSRRSRVYFEAFSLLAGLKDPESGGVKLLLETLDSTSHVRLDGLPRTHFRQRQIFMDVIQNLILIEGRAWREASNDLEGWAFLDEYERRIALNRHFALMTLRKDLTTSSLNEPSINSPGEKESAKSPVRV